MKYDFLVYPGGDPRDIRMRYEGADAIEQQGNGGLHIRNSLGVVGEGQPSSFQGDSASSDPVRVTTAVGSRYRVSGYEIGFDIDHYDSGRTLVIDPALEWATYVGGSGNEGYWPYFDQVIHPYVDFDMQTARIASIATYPAGGVVVASSTTSLDFPLTTGAFQMKNAGDVVDLCVVHIILKIKWFATARA